MHSVIRPDGSHTQSRLLQVALVLSYLCFSVAGALILFSPRLDVTFGASGHWMAGFMASGGLLCLLGNISRRWVGEFLGGPLLGTGLAVFGLEAWHVLSGQYPYFALGEALLLVGSAFLIVGRWRRVFATYQFVHAVARMEGRARGHE